MHVGYWNKWETQRLSFTAKYGVWLSEIEVLRVLMEDYMKTKKYGVWLSEIEVLRVLVEDYVKTTTRETSIFNLKPSRFTGSKYFI